MRLLVFIEYDVRRPNQESTEQASNTSVADSSQVLSALANWCPNRAVARVSTYGPSLGVARPHLRAGRCSRGAARCDATTWFDDV